MADIQFSQNIFHQYNSINGELIIDQPPSRDVNPILFDETRVDVFQDPGSNDKIIQKGQLPSGVNLGPIYDGDNIHRRQTPMRLSDGDVLVIDDIMPAYAPIIFERGPFQPPPKDFKLESNYIKDLRNNTHADGTPNINKASNATHGDSEEKDDIVQRLKDLNNKNNFFEARGLKPDSPERALLIRDISVLENKFKSQFPVDRQALLQAETVEELRNVKRLLAIDRLPEIEFKDDDEEDDEMDRLLRERLEGIKGIRDQKIDSLSSTLTGEGFSEDFSIKGDGSISSSSSSDLGSEKAESKSDDGEPIRSISSTQKALNDVKSLKNMSGEQIYELNKSSELMKKIMNKNAEIMEELKAEALRSDVEGFNDILKEQIKDILNNGSDALKYLTQVPIVASFTSYGMDKPESRIKLLNLDDEILTHFTDDDFKRLSSIYRLYGGYPEIYNRARLKSFKPNLFSFSNKEIIKSEVKYEDDGDKKVEHLILGSTPTELERLTIEDAQEIINYIENDMGVVDITNSLDTFTRNMTVKKGKIADRDPIYNIMINKIESQR